MTYATNLCRRLDFQLLIQAAAALDASTVLGIMGAGAQVGPGVVLYPLLTGAMALCGHTGRALTTDGAVGAPPYAALRRSPAVCAAVCSVAVALPATSQSPLYGLGVLGAWTALAEFAHRKHAAALRATR